jgi:HD superfamily phosphodiesterase
LQSRAEESQSEWHDQIFESLSHLFAGQAESNLYGSGHARAVEAAILDVLAASEYERIEGIDVPVLQSAALLHDAGFARRAQSWSLDCFEHVEAGKQLASEILTRNA